jgi:hypothetical protein
MQEKQTSFKQTFNTTGLSKSTSLTRFDNIKRQQDKILNTDSKEEILNKMD